MIKSVLLSLLVIVVAIKGKILTSKQITILLGGGIFSIVISYVLASLMEISFIDMLTFNSDWSYGHLSVATAYLLIGSSIVASIRKFLAKSN
ncbi:MAG: hypothetical protein DRR06_09080 [Gammaproteobacteria bacterium]|nr:MAG: hypothetical protein DRR06_09080 [Gammaproteobacteria bacterium]